MGFSWLNLEKSQTSYIWPGPAGPGLKSGPGRARPNTQVPGRAGPTRLTLLKTMVSDYRIGSNFFSWLHVCLLYVVDTVPRAPRAHGHVHVPFYEGMCPKN